MSRGRRVTTVVAILGAPELARELGKRGTASDLTLFNLVRDGRVLTAVEPTQFPEKLPPLLFALQMAEEAILVVSGLTRTFAELVATVDLFALPVTLCLAPGVGEAEVRKALKGTRLEPVAVSALEPARLRDELLSRTPPPPPDGPVQVRIDHAFPVKGVGPVALGFVRRGTLTAHDRLRLYPLPQQVEVRSIQVQDVDVKEAGAGTRVGLALRGVEAETLGRGQILAPGGTLACGNRVLLRDWTGSRYFRSGLEPGGQWQLLVGLQLVPARLEAIGEGRVTLLADRPVAGELGEGVWLADLSQGAGPRLAGRGRLDELKSDSGAMGSAPP